jgi:monolysocardiolipin acyltransferase
MRWSLGAEELLFTHGLGRWFFGSSGKVLPVRRGDGIMQPALNQAIEYLNDGAWVHVFPEGKVIPKSDRWTRLAGDAGGPPRLKWGISRLILESQQPPLLIPMIHRGMEDIKPFHRWYVLPFRQLTVRIGNPIDTSTIRGQVRHLSGRDQRLQTTLWVANQMKQIANQ